MSYQSINPATGETVKSFEEISDSELETALERAAVCYESWRCLTFAERAVISHKAAEILRSRMDEFARPMTLEMGKRFEEAQAEVELSADIIDYETGMVFINHPTWTASDLPFGGIKNSGYGRELSRLGIQEFMNKKLVRTKSIDATV